jgi:hypothetical protein
VFSNQVFKSVLRRALLEEGQEFGVFDPMGSGSITFDITEIYPKSRLTLLTIVAACAWMVRCRQSLTVRAILLR